MTILKKLLAQFLESPESRLNELYLYESVAEEISQGTQIKGLFAKALMEANGNQEVAKGRYIKLRVQMLKDQIDVELKKSQYRVVTTTPGSGVARFSCPPLSPPKEKRKKAKIRRKKVPTGYDGPTQACLRCQKAFPLTTDYYSKYKSSGGRSFRSVCRWCMN